jgi:hypothetical protein
VLFEGLGMVKDMLPFVFYAGLVVDGYGAKHLGWTLQTLAAGGASLAGLLNAIKRIVRLRRRRRS